MLSDLTAALPTAAAAQLWLPMLFYDCYELDLLKSQAESVWPSVL